MYIPPYFEPYIRREDANGNLLSTVRINNYYWWEIIPILYESVEPDRISPIRYDLLKIVTVTLPDGTAVSQKFIDPTIEDILNFARKVEQENPLEKLRQELLDKVDSTIKYVEAEIAELEARLKEVEARLAEENEAIKNEALDLLESIEQIIESLRAIMDDERLSDDLRQMIAVYVARTQHYLSDDNFQNQVDIFIKSRSWEIGYLQHKIELRNQFIKDFAGYMEQVKAAKTVEELQRLADNFPQFFEPEVMPPYFVDPLPEARADLAQGQNLLAKAREEIGNVTIKTAKDFDLNHDGIVDTADYLMLRKNGASAEDLALWRSFYGVRV
jgi:hypothetical protein